LVDDGCGGGGGGDDDDDDDEEEEEEEEEGLLNLLLQNCFERICIGDGEWWCLY
jgi:hypothetical protein